MTFPTAEEIFRLDEDDEKFLAVFDEEAARLVEGYLHGTNPWGHAEWSWGGAVLSLGITATEERLGIVRLRPTKVEYID